MPDFLKATQSYCTPHADDEGSDFAEGYDQVHERFYDLVLMLPARK